MAASSISQCPDCSRIIHFSSDLTNMGICGSCGTIVWRTMAGIISRSPQFPILQKNEIIQPGTTGTWQSERFTVLGRFRAWFEESVFNYWTISFDNGRIAWLGEGYGIYAVLRSMPEMPAFDYRKLRGAKNGTIIDLKPDAPFTLRKKQLALKWEVEGELFVLSPDPYLCVADFSAQDGSHITIFEWGEKQIHFYQVQYTSFKELQLENLRPYTYSDKNFSCSKCSTRIEIKTFPYAQSCACPQCGSCYELRNGMDFKRDSVKAANNAIDLPIGSTGKIDDISYEVIGFVQKQENNAEAAAWSEYTIFNPEHGFATLSVYNGHWIFVKEQSDSPMITATNYQKIIYDDEPFHLYNSYTHKVTGAAGEFPYNIFDNEKTKAREFISPPEMWIEERNPDEGVTWYFAKHISRKNIEKAFSPATMPPQIGVGAIQPTGFANSTRIVQVTLWSILILCLIHICINMSKHDLTILEKTYPIPDSTNTASIVTEKFHLDKWSSNLEFYIEAGVNNSWFELNATLVNTDNGKEYSLEKGVEYYEGYSEGEHWTEGSREGTVYLTKIPAGNYFLQLQGTREAPVSYAASPISSFFIRIKYDVPTYRNLFWSIALLLIWPFAVGYMNHQKEANRWFSSPFSTDNS
ncbi:MAG: hypothetical protein DI535_14685 [Citrobacter freundii]|nr:MAG: hypothetical protein DI535_14685 [Citrobacter freundii]